MIFLRNNNNKHQNVMVYCMILSLIENSTCLAPFFTSGDLRFYIENLAPLMFMITLYAIICWVCEKLVEATRKSLENVQLYSHTAVRITVMQRPYCIL